MLGPALLISAAMLVVTVIIQIAGFTILIGIMRRRAARIAGFAHVMEQMGVILGVVMGLFVMHALQIALYATLYLVLGEFDTLEPALYFSTITFTTVGYGEIYLESGWRIISAVQSANGFLVLGWSTVFLISVLSRLRSVEMDWLESRIEPELFDRDRES